MRPDTQQQGSLDDLAALLAACEGRGNCYPVAMWLELRIGSGGRQTVRGAVEATDGGNERQIYEDQPERRAIVDAPVDLRRRPVMESICTNEVLQGAPRASDSSRGCFLSGSVSSIGATGLHVDHAILLSVSSRSRRAQAQAPHQVRGAIRMRPQPADGGGLCPLPEILPKISRI